MKAEKRILVISFTEQGSQINRRIGKNLMEIGYRCACYAVERFANRTAGEEVRLLPLPEKEKRSEWIGQHWGKDVFLFIGASGIAVRLIAPWVTDKFTDSPVLVMDEQANYVIPLLSGHVGGAVEIAKEIAGCMGAVPVITTATDVEQVFAVDVFAVDNGLRIGSRTVAKQISAALLDGKCVGFYAEYPWKGMLPRQLCLCESRSELETFVKKHGLGIWVGVEKEDATGVLRLFPQNLVVGIGCRRGTEEAVLESGLREILEAHGYVMEQIAAIASITLKQDEPGMIELAEKLRIPFQCYSPEELRKTGKVEETSEFVRSVTGVDNVCERAARACAPDGTVVFGKNCRRGMTAAAVEKNVELRFR